jgi:hypothetical protein
VFPKDLIQASMLQRTAFTMDNSVSLPPGLNLIPFCEPLNADVGMLGRFFLNVAALQEKFQDDTVLRHVETLNFKYMLQ